MKRRLLIVAVFLLAGAVVNVAVAWGCSLFVPLNYGVRTMGPIEIVPVDEPVWHLKVNTQLGALRIDSYAAMNKWVVTPERSIPKWSRAFQPPTKADFDLPFIREQALGLPLLSLHYRDYDSTRYIGAILVEPRRSPSILCVVPIWTGFTANTIFYAAVLWLLICGPFALRRLIRVKRGLCPACAYPRGESDVCSECGKELAT